MSGEPMGEEMVRLRIPVFLPKLPSEVREEARLCVVEGPVTEMGEGRYFARGDVVSMRGGDGGPFDTK